MSKNNGEIFELAANNQKIEEIFFTEINTF